MCTTVQQFYTETKMCLGAILRVVRVWYEGLGQPEESIVVILQICSALAQRRCATSSTFTLMKFRVVENPGYHLGTP